MAGGTGALWPLGIRHHGPGSARSVVRALDGIRPDHILIEGPPEATSLVRFLAHVDLVPPVAVLVHLADRPTVAAFWPFSASSPELAAARWALDRGVSVAFADQPTGPRLARRLIEDLAADRCRVGPQAGPRPRTGVAADPIRALASAGGHQDPERWWEDLVEARGCDDADLFDAVAEAMAALRDHRPHDDEEAVREASMRQAVRAAWRLGAQRVAFVCGAWHVPALTEPLPPARVDTAALKGLAKAKVAASMVPWSNGQLVGGAGYAAGVESPGWYAHLHEHPIDPVAPWMARAAWSLRARGIDVAPASVIDAVRLAHATAAVRGRPLAGLGEVQDAARAALCGGLDRQLRVLHDEMVIGRAVGRVPDGVPTTPLVADVRATVKRLRLKLEEVSRVLELDLRAEAGKARSHLLHRLGLLGAPWGTSTETAAGSMGTFKEAWSIAWSPELELVLVDASRRGSTLVEAASDLAVELAWSGSGLTQLTALVEQTLLADLPDATVHVVAALEVNVSVGADVPQLLAALPALVRLSRYGSVRRADADTVTHVIASMAERASVGLALAARGIDATAGALLADALRAADGALGTYDDARLLGAWHAAVGAVGRDQGAEGNVAGTATRLCLDAGELDQMSAAIRVASALSVGVDPQSAAAFVEGFLAGPGLLLVHDDELFAVVDGWLCALPSERFDEVLPLLRRTLARFARPERAAVGDRVRRGADAASMRRAGAPLDARRVALTGPVLAAVTGVAALGRRWPA